MDNTLGYELSNGGSIPSRRTNQQGEKYEVCKNRILFKEFVYE